MPAAAACPQAVRDGDILRMWNEDVEGLQTCFAGLFDDFSPLRPDRDNRLPKLTYCCYSKCSA
jgi:hypothetical protein